MNALNLDLLFDQQLAQWSACAQRYEQLSAAQRREISIGNKTYTLIYNPLRARSVLADVESEKSEQSCFLCLSNRPKEQTYISVAPIAEERAYHIAVNPFPILSHHFTLIAAAHTPQALTQERLSDMAALAQQMEGYMLFFNGAASGASAPAHFHFQAVRCADVPLFRWREEALESLFIQTCEAQRVKIEYEKTDMTNVLCWYDARGLHWVVVSRCAHRPQQYFAQGAEQTLLSPASLEYAGVIPLIREEDYKKMTPELLGDMLRQCYDNEPLVDVGLYTNNPQFTPNADGTTTIEGVTIGKSFHWEQQRALTYEGQLLQESNTLAEGVSFVNRLKAERYLLSVISSEMSAEADINFLKAHAVIARSWLVHLLNRKNLSSEPSPHALFDVCSDDHCQRYQGLPTRQSDRVEQAIRETLGEVMMYEGAVVDARYSKCCGGRTEEYRYCWEEREVPYLRSVADERADGSIFCNTSDASILNLVLNDYDRATRDFFSWTATYSQAQLSDLIERKGQLGLGLVIDLIPLERGRSGRISKLRIVGERGEAVVGKELEIRRLLSETHLYSSNFTVVLSKDQDEQLLFTFNGRGWGHGVGLCQIGAAVMGAEGYDYKTILQHYYKGVTIEKIW